MEEGYYTSIQKAIKKEKPKEIVYEIPEINNHEVYEFSYFRFFVFVFGILAFVLLGYGLYLANEGKFQSIIDQPISTDTSINNTVHNQYSFNPQSTNSYTINFNATVVVPMTINVDSNHT